LFGFDSKSTIQNSFQTFSKTRKYKTIGCFDKITGCFSLSLKKTLNANIIYPKSYSKAHQQQQTPPVFHQTQRIWILQSLNTLNSTIFPYLMKTNPWLIVLYLIESEAVPTKQILSCTKTMAVG